MDEASPRMELPHDPCLDHDLSCLTHDLSCLDQHHPCFTHDLSCFDRHDTCPNPHVNPCISNPHDPSYMHQDIPCLDECEQFYLHIKPHVDDLEDVIKNSSIIMNELFDSKDYFNIDHGVDGEEGESSNDMENQTLLPSYAASTTNYGSDESLRSCRDIDVDEDFQDEEALLLAEVEKAEKLGLRLEGGSEGSAGTSGRAVEESKGKSSDSEQSSSRGPRGGGSGGSSSRRRRRRRRKKKKIKVDWTPELHQGFVHIVEQLGADKAIPSRILELMGVNCLTRHNVASHLQKYRSHKKHILQTRNEEIVITSTAHNLKHRHMEVATSIVTKNQPSMPSSTGKMMRPIRTHGNTKSQSQHRPMLRLPELHVWGHPTTMDQRFWPHCWPSGPSRGCLMDAWGQPFLYAPVPQPILRIPLAPMPAYVNNRIVRPKHQPAKETVAASISEVLRNPLMPLPLGLKPPPLESVIFELQNQGISI